MAGRFVPSMYKPAVSLPVFVDILQVARALRSQHLGIDHRALDGIDNSCHTDRPGEVDFGRHRRRQIPNGGKQKS